MSAYEKELDELAQLLQPHMNVSRTGGPNEAELSDAEDEIGFELPADYRAFSKDFGSIPWPYPIADAVEACELLEDFDVPRNFVPFGELDHIIAGFRADSDSVWLWDGLKLNNTQDSFLAWLKALATNTAARQQREAEEAAAALEEPSVEESAGSPKEPRKPRTKRSPSSVKRSKIPADAPKRLKKLVKLVRLAGRFEAFEADGDRWGVRVPEEGGVRTSFVTAEELLQIEAW
ncbi:MAG: SMI1/KNR4 family protein, partial [Bradymonadaceae bacterium]